KQRSRVAAALKAGMTKEIFTFRVPWRRAGVGSPEHTGEEPSQQALIAGTAAPADQIGHGRLDGLAQEGVARPGFQDTCHRLGRSPPARGIEERLCLVPAEPREVLGDGLESLR